MSSVPSCALLDSWWYLSPHDLEVPEDNRFVERKEMLSLLLHPDSRQHAGLPLTRLWVDLAIPIDAQGNAWLMDADQIQEVESF